MYDQVQKIYLVMIMTFDITSDSTTYVQSYEVNSAHWCVSIIFIPVCYIVWNFQIFIPITKFLWKFRSLLSTFTLVTNLKIFIKYSKDGRLLLDTLVKVLKKYKKSCNFHEIMPNCPEVKLSFEFFSQSLLKVTINTS